MGERGLQVQTSTAQMQVVGKRHFGRKAVAHGGGGGRGASRELFDTLLLWQGKVKLDARGEAQVQVPLNDSLTSFRIVAVASAGAGLFGTGAVEVRSTQDLMLMSGLPQLVREGDRLRAGFTVRNALDRRPAGATDGARHGRRGRAADAGRAVAHAGGRRVARGRLGLRGAAGAHAALAGRCAAAALPATAYAYRRRWARRCRCARCRPRCCSSTRRKRCRSRFRRTPCPAMAACAPPSARAWAATWRPCATTWRPIRIPASSSAPRAPWRCATKRRGRGSPPRCRPTSTATACSNISRR